MENAVRTLYVQYLKGVYITKINEQGVAFRQQALFGVHYARAGLYRDYHDINRDTL